MRQVGTDAPPVETGVGSFEEKLRAVIQDVAVLRRENEWGLHRTPPRPQKVTVRPSVADIGRYVEGLPGASNPAVNCGAIVAREYPLRMCRVRFNLPVFVGAHREPPVHEVNGAESSPAAHRNRAIVLLWAINPEGELVICSQMVHLPGRLVVPTAPRPASIQADACSLVGAQDHLAAQTALAAIHWQTWAFGVYPQDVIVIAAWRTFYNLECFAAVDRAIKTGVNHIDNISILGIHPDLIEKTRSPAGFQPWILRDLPPARPAIVGTKQPALKVVLVSLVPGNNREDAPAISCQPDPPHGPGGKAVAGYGLPGFASVGGFIDGTAGLVI